MKFIAYWIKRSWSVVKTTLFRKWTAYVLIALTSLYAIYNTPWQEALEKLDPAPLTVVGIAGNPVFTRRDDIEDALEKMGGLKGFFGQDIQEVNNQLKQLSWIKNLAVRKQWPNQLYIWVSDYTPIATWNNDEFLAKNGHIFSLPLEKISPKNLPQLVGPNEKTGLLLMTWQAMFKQLQQQNLTLKKLELNERGSWTATLSDDTVLKLGRNNWEKKLANFAIIYPTIEIPAQKKLAYVDLRYPAGASIKLIDSDTAQSENKE